MQCSSLLNDEDQEALGYKTLGYTNAITPFHGSQYMTNFSNLINCCWLQCSSLLNDEDQEVLGYKTLRCTNAIAAHRVYGF